MNKALFKYFATVLIITLLFSSSVSMVILSDQMMQTTRKEFAPLIIEDFTPVAWASPI